MWKLNFFKLIDCVPETELNNSYRFSRSSPFSHTHNQCDSVNEEKVALSFQFPIQGKLASWALSCCCCAKLLQWACLLLKFYIRAFLARTRSLGLSVSCGKQKHTQKNNVDFNQKSFVASAALLIKYSISWAEFIALTWANDFVCWFHNHNYHKEEKRSKIDSSNMTAI